MKRPALAALLLSACLVGGCVAAVVATSPGAIGAPAQASGATDPRSALDEPAHADPASPHGARPAGHAGELRPDRRHPPHLEPALPLPRHAGVARLRRGDGPEHLPDPARPLPDRRQVAEPVVGPAELAVGGRPETDPAPPEPPPGPPPRGPP